MSIFFSCFWAFFLPNVPDRKSDIIFFLFLSAACLLSSGRTELEMSSYKHQTTDIWHSVTGQHIMKLSRDVNGKYTLKFNRKFWQYWNIECSRSQKWILLQNYIKLDSSVSENSPISDEHPRHIIHYGLLILNLLYLLLWLVWTMNNS